MEYLIECQLCGVIEKDSNGPWCFRIEYCVITCPMMQKPAKMQNRLAPHTNSWRIILVLTTGGHNIRSWLQFQHWSKEKWNGFVEIRQQRILSILKRQHMTKRRASFCSSFGWAGSDSNSEAAFYRFPSGVYGRLYRRSHRVFLLMLAAKTANDNLNGYHIAKTEAV